MPDTNYQIAFEDRGGYLFVHLTGTDSFAASLSYWHEIADKADELGQYRVLVHEALEGQVSEAEMFDIMNDVVPSGLGVRIAFYDENQDNAQVNELGQLIAENRGAIIKIFGTLTDAERWLLSDV